MKINKYFIKSLDSPFVSPSFCRGTGALIAIGAGSAAAGLAGASMTNEANMDINESNQSFSSSEAQKQREWQRDEWTRQYQMQRDEWYKQLEASSNEYWKNFLREAEYNSPKNQVSRLSSAGLNPAAVLGGQGSSGLIAASTGNVHAAPTPSVPTGGAVSGASAAAPQQIPMQNPFNLSSVGSFLRDLATANKDTATVRPYVEYLGAQLIGQNLQNEWQSFQNDILSQIKDVKVKSAFEELQSVVLDNVLKVSMNENVSQDTVLKATESALNIAKEKLTSEEYSKLAFYVSRLSQTYQLEMNVLRSQAASNYGSAAYTSAMAASENAVREFKTKNAELLNVYQTFINESAGNEAELSSKLKDARYRSMLKQLSEQARQSGILSDTYQQQLEMAEKNNNWWLVNNLLLPVMQQFDIKLPHQVLNSIPDKVSKVGSIIK